jgi:uncharacterized membrane protein YbaN (DUF454 family)
MRSLIRPLLIVLGTLAVALAVIGMFIPILPTTPFLLLAAACYARSSDRFLNWLLHNRWFGAYIRNYRAGRGMPRLTKILTLSALWATLLLSGTIAVSAWWLRLMLVLVGAGVTIHLLRIPTYNPGPDSASPAPVHSSPRSSDKT